MIQCRSREVCWCRSFCLSCSPPRAADADDADRYVFGDLSTPFDRPSANANVADDETFARWHLILNSQGHSRDTANDGPVVTDWRTVRFDPASVIEAGD